MYKQRVVCKSTLCFLCKLFFAFSPCIYTKTTENDNFWKRSQKWKDLETQWYRFQWKRSVYRTTTWKRIRVAGASQHGPITNSGTGTKQWCETCLFSHGLDTGRDATVNDPTYVLSPIVSQPSKCLKFYTFREGCFDKRYSFSEIRWKQRVQLKPRI